MHNFQSYTYSNEFDIIAITETWLTKHIYTNELLPCGYNVLRKDRDGRGGGVLLALKDSISLRELSTPNDLEVLSAEVTINNLNFVICLIYRPPNYAEQYDTLLLSYLHSVNNSTDLLIIGDLNLPDVDWNTYSGYSTISNAYAEVVYDLNLMQLITSPTHIVGNVLDVILTNCDYCQNIDIHSNLPPGLSSDHHIITFSIVHYHNKATDSPKHKYNYAKANWEDMNQYFYHYNFNQCFNSVDTEFIWDQLKTAIYNALNRYVPTVPITTVNQPKWFTPSIRHKVKCLRTLKRRFAAHPTEKAKQKIKSMESELQHLTAQAKTEYESQLVLNFAHSNNNKIFQYISSIRGHTNLPTQMFHNSYQATNDQEKAQLFNTYFYSVFSTNDNAPVSVLPTCSRDHTLHDVEIIESEVLVILNSLDVNKAAGIDNICPNVFRYCALSLLKPICHLFTVSLSTGNIPIQWRTHCVTPIYKSGDKSSVSNYRPISLLCILSKVLEKIVRI